MRSEWDDEPRLARTEVTGALATATRRGAPSPALEALFGRRAAAVAAPADDELLAALDAAERRERVLRRALQVLAKAGPLRRRRLVRELRSRGYVR